MARYSYLSDQDTLIYWGVISTGVWRPYMHVCTCKFPEIYKIIISVFLWSKSVLILIKWLV